MPEHNRSIATHKIDVFIPVYVPYSTSLAALHELRKPLWK
jgi:hypothetical protein